MRETTNYNCNKSQRPQPLRLLKRDLALDEGQIDGSQRPQPFESREWGFEIRDS